jgi:hypothetical protein
MHEHGPLPRARQDDLLVDTVGEELLLYDQNTHTAHCLSPVAACVWRHCDGKRDVTELAELAGASENLVADALHELREKDLLDAEPQPMKSAVPGMSRREAIVRIGRVGAGAAAASMIVSATAATPAMASSGEEAGKCAPTWSATTTYAEDQKVEYSANSLKCWGSLKGSNKGNVPSLGSEWWDLLLGDCDE